MALFSQVAGFEITCPIMNGAGIYKYPDAEFSRYLSINNAAQIALGGTFTPPPREGNTGGEVHYLAKSTGHPSNVDLNKLGFPNPGKAGLVKFITETAEEAFRNEKLVGANISGASEYSIDEMAEMFRECLVLGVRYIQVNTSCSNLMLGSRKQKPVICYNLTLMKELLDKLKAIVEEFKGKIQRYIVDIKVAYFPDVVYHEELAALISEYDFIDVISAINTIGNAKRFTNEGKAIICTDGFAGGSGPGIFPFAIGQVSRWRQLLPERIRVIGVGGIMSGADVREMMYAGADIVQIVSAYFRSGGDAGEYNRVCGEYLSLVG